MNLRAVLALLLLSGCDRSDSLVTLQPTLVCEHGVWCHLIEWQVGVKFGPKLAGTHGGCHCTPAKS